MSTGALKEHYTHRVAQFEEAIATYNRNMRMLGLLRLAMVVAQVWFLVLGLREQEALYFLGTALFMIVFLFLVTRYNAQKDLREFNRQQKALNERELACLEHRYRHLDDGSDFSDPGHPWSHDLDLFGKGSLFQYLNRCSTMRGRQELARLLCTEAGNPARVYERQALVSDLQDRVDFRQAFTARGEMFQEESGDLNDISQWLDNPVYIQQKPWLFHIAIFMSVVSLGILTACVFNGALFLLLVPVAVLNFLLLSPFLLRTGRYQNQISKKHEMLRGYALLLGLVAGERFKHSSLQTGQQESMEGMREVRKLSRLVNLFDQRLSMLLGPIFNGLFLFDFLLLHFLERWKHRNREHILRWIDLITQLDAFISLAGFAYNHPDFSQPIFTEQEGDTEPFKVLDLGHPLIHPDKRVDNSLEIGAEKVVIITGANMAGKSTFLRALGVNLVLAYTGVPVCASHFHMKYMGLFSSMRTADSLAEDESYFFAEIKKLQRIVQAMEQGLPLLILLDEVLKGTNTTDKKKGSVGLIHRCLPYPVRCFIATHDLSLGELEATLPGQVLNYCFESYIEDLELGFDYKIQRGLATNMNASFLMKQMGIME